MEKSRGGKVAGTLAGFAGSERLKPFLYQTDNSGGNEVTERSYVQ